MLLLNGYNISLLHGIILQMIINKIKIALLFITSVTLIACVPDNKDGLTNICESDPELCSDLHKIGDCRYKRTSLIRARFYDKVEPSELHTRDLLRELDEYESCLELTLFMQFTRHKERKTHRIENFLTAQKLMQSKLEASKGTQNPHLAYYLWSHYQDQDAKRVFLKATRNKNLKDPKLLIKLARVYAKNNPQHALNLFYKALQGSKSIDELPESTFTLIMSIYYQNRAFEQAYIWALIAIEEDTEKAFPINLDLILQKGLINGEKKIKNADALQKKAANYHNALENGLFTRQAPHLAR